MMKKLQCAWILLLCAALCGCTGRTVEAQSFALDTVVTVRLISNGSQEDAEDALALIDQCEEILSAHRAGSDIDRINSAPAGQEVSVSERTASVLLRALELCGHTQGALDITLYEVSALWDYKSENPQVPDEETLAQALAKTGLDRIALSGSTVSAEGVRLDLGAVAKGAIGDEAIALLKERGVKCALINLGGNILTLGNKPDGTPWRVAIDSPFGEGYVGTLTFSGGKAVSTSSGAQRFFVKDGVVYHHILDPKSGYPADSGLGSVTVIHSSGLVADGLSTALFVAGEEEAVRVLKEHYPEAAAVLVRADGTVRVLGEVDFSQD